MSEFLDQREEEVSADMQQVLKTLKQQLRSVASVFECTVDKINYSNTTGGFKLQLGVPQNQTEEIVKLQSPDYSGVVHVFIIAE